MFQSSHQAGALCAGVVVREGFLEKVGLGWP